MPGAPVKRRRGLKEGKTVEKGSQRGIFILLLICAVYAVSLISSTYRFFRTSPEEALEGGKRRIVAVIPNTGNVDVEGIRLGVEEMGERYGAFVELYETATREEQLQVLQIAVDSGVDGVLLYPMEKTGYEFALSACRRREIPVVVISQRLEDVAFDTYIGSAVNSERMAVLSCISATGGTGRVLIVDRLNSGGRLYMEAAVLEPSEITAPGDGPELKTRVSNLVGAPFEGYRVEDVTVMDEKRSSSYSLHNEVRTLLETQRPDAVFSYDEDVTNVIAACLTGEKDLRGIYAVGYGDVTECAEYLRGGTLDGLVQQNDAYSASLAVRYLVELRKGSIMPSGVDSGIALISANNLERMLVGNEK